jgi:Fur family ferric uptake transcriptional regulator
MSSEILDSHVSSANGLSSLSQDLISKNKLDKLQIEKFFEARGVRWTPQRQMVIDSFFNNKGHISAEEIHSEIKKVFPKVNLSTIYRTLELLCELGVAVEVVSQGDDRRRYELIGDDHHHHLSCQHCHKEIELDSSIIRSIINEVRAEYGFRLELPHFVGYGLCDRCVQKYTLD